MTCIVVLLVVTVIVAWKCRRWVQLWNLLDKGIRQMKEEARGFAGDPLLANPYFAIETTSYSGGPRNDDGPGHGGSSAMLRVEEMPADVPVGQPEVESPDTIVRKLLR